jgi:hypothetical protein
MAKACSELAEGMGISLGRERSTPFLIHWKDQGWLRREVSGEKRDET